jgi:hypothetical protein
MQGSEIWIVTSALAVVLIGLVLGLLGGRFTPKFKPTRLQWLGIYQRALACAFHGSLPALHSRNKMARSFPTRLCRRHRLWDANMVRSFPKKLINSIPGNDFVKPNMNHPYIW